MSGKGNFNQTFMYVINLDKSICQVLRTNDSLRMCDFKNINFCLYILSDQNQNYISIWSENIPLFQALAIFLQVVP